MNRLLHFLGLYDTRGKTRRRRNQTINAATDGGSLTVQLAERSYSIRFGSDILTELPRALAGCGIGKRLLIVTDRNVGELYCQRIARLLADSGFELSTSTLEPGEASKSLECAAQVYDAAIAAGLDRRSAIVAVGGGVVGDLAGFVAATFARGIAFVQVPTTLLAMVDSAVGGKVGIDRPQAKNIVGAFHQPAAVLCDIALLQTLPEREWRSGLAEVVKYGVILDADFFEWLEANAGLLAARERDATLRVVRRSCELKAGVVEQDERETGNLRVMLNYGHTFGHAIETTTGYCRFAHGEAVAIGMMCAARLAAARSLVGQELVDRQASLWKSLGLPTALPADLPGGDLLAAMRRDKKNANGRIRLVLPLALGTVRLIDDVGDAEILAALRQSVEC